MEFYSCEMGAFMCDQSLFSQIRSGTLFSLHIKNDSANVPNTSPWKKKTQEEQKLALVFQAVKVLFAGQSLSSAFDTMKSYAWF